MERCKIFALAFCCVGFFLMAGCIAPQQQEEEFAFSTKCAVYENVSYDVDEWHWPISQDIKCNGSLSKDETLTLNIVDSKNLQQPLVVYTYLRDYTFVWATIDEVGMCELNETELEEVTKMPDATSQWRFCVDRRMYNSYLESVENGPTPGRAVINFTKYTGGGDPIVVSRNPKGKHGGYNMFYVTFFVGERVDVVNPQTNETNLTAYQRVQNDLSCKGIGDLFRPPPNYSFPFPPYKSFVFYSYNCGVPATFLAIPIAK